MQALLRIAVVSAVLFGAAPRDVRAKEPAAAKPTQVVLLDPVTGSDGDANARKTLYTSLTRHLKAQGFTVTSSGSPRFRLRPSLIRLDVVRKGGAVEVAAKTAIAVVEHGRLDTGFERLATVRSENPKARSAQLTASAIDAAAGALAKDAAGRIAEMK
jgi:hypothetical protein